MTRVPVFLVENVEKNAGPRVIDLTDLAKVMWGYTAGQKPGRTARRNFPCIFSGAFFLVHLH